jgi:hypothetical protein
MKTISELITEHAAKIKKAHEDNTFGDYTSEGLLSGFTLDLMENGHIAVPKTPVTRASTPRTRGGCFTDAADE